MTFFEYSMIYIICWWLALFMVLPFKAQRPVEEGGVAYTAAPARAHLKGKLIATTLLAAVLAALVVFCLQNPEVKSWLAGS